ncbi:MAG TPA: FlgO family outer membrane protein, partial [Pyrinomonadaceae bacterium]|nr:FlgO family outer membrane protein [Pyrinomonadaceae bacterium]
VMRKVVLSLCMVISVAACASSAWAQGGLDQRISELSQKISNGLTENQKRTIAVVEFADLRGNVTDFGRFIAEELITHLHETKKFKVIERQLLNKIVAEQKLSLGGMIDQTSAQKLGKLLGVDAIASGTVTDLGKSLRVNARLISTGTGEVFAVAATEIVKDDSVIALTGAGGTGPTSPSPGTSGSGTSPQVANAIAVKDISSLRVVLKSIMRVNLKDGNGRSVNGIRCSFEFMNLETQRQIVVAMNAIAPDRDFTTIGSYLRSTLVDENGGLWRLRNSDVAGMSIVGVGSRGYIRTYYNPAEIVIVLSKRDDLMSDVTLMGGYSEKAHFIFGSTTEMSPGQSLTVTTTFVQDANQAISGAPPKVFQIASEIVVGIPKTDTTRSYSLHNFTFDRVSLPAGAR